MNYYTLKLCGLTRKLSIVALGPKLKIASFSLLGDGELVEKVAVELEKKIRKFDFDYLVGPEVKVVPLIHALSKRLDKPRYVVLRKNIRGYMVKPILNRAKPTLVLNGPDAKILRGKKVVVVDDVISTGRTIKVVKTLMEMIDAEVAGVIAVLRQGQSQITIKEPFLYLATLPVFR